jgi:hypothetical protein
MGFEYGAHSVTLHTIDSSTIKKFGGIRAMGMPMNTEVTQDDNGQIYDSFVGINLQAPTPRFTTTALGLAVATVPQTGICINTDETHPGIKFFGEAKGDCQSGEPGAGDHMSYLMDAGLIVPMTLTASRREAARISFEIDAITPDGVNAPFVADPTDTLPTGLNIDEFILGAMRIGNIVWDDARSLNLNFNVTRLEKEAMLGGIWPDRASRTKARPEATITGRDPRKLDDSTGIPFVGKSATHVDTILYFRKRKNAAALEDAASLVHLKLTIAGMVYFENPFEASGAGAAETTVMIKGIHDGTNVPLIWTPDVAYDPTP